MSGSVRIIYEYHSIEEGPKLDTMPKVGSSALPVLSSSMSVASFLRACSGSESSPRVSCQMVLVARKNAEESKGCVERLLPLEVPLA